MKLGRNFCETNYANSVTKNLIQSTVTCIV